MAKFLLLGAVEPNWRLPAEADLAQVRHNLDFAYDNQFTAKVTVELGDDPRQRSTVAVNPRALAWWAVVETAEPPGPTARLIA